MPRRRFRSSAPMRPRPREDSSSMAFFASSTIKTISMRRHNLFNQNIDAQGVSFSSSVGYQWQVPNSKWFIEPSAGVIISRVKVDPFNFQSAGTSGFSQFNGTLQLDDRQKRYWRFGVRVGTTINSGNLILQPFAAVSFWHEFGPDVSANYQTCGASNGWGRLSLLCRGRQHLHILDHHLKLRHLRTVLARLLCCGQKHGLACLRSRRLSRGPQSRRAERDRRHPLSVHAGEIAPVDQGSSAGGRGRRLDRLLCRRLRQRTPGRG